MLPCRTQKYRPPSDLQALWHRTTLDAFLVRNPSQLNGFFSAVRELAMGRPSWAVLRCVQTIVADLLFKPTADGSHRQYFETRYPLLAASLSWSGPATLAHLRQAIRAWRFTLKAAPVTDHQHVAGDLWLLLLSCRAQITVALQHLFDRSNQRLHSAVPVCLEYLTLLSRPVAHPVTEQKFAQDLGEMISVFNQLYCPGAEFHAIVVQFMEDCLISRQNDFLFLLVQIIFDVFIPQATTQMDKGTWVRQLLEFLQHAPKHNVKGDPTTPPLNTIALLIADRLAEAPAWATFWHQLRVDRFTPE
ncbi:hypothetical protein H4R34_002860 [Dimargaris verticillata]|uniref:Uncharacterized protein n=1 Tax=Dimargaris verticillata TaxID=2761393 RepID=A0A9W8B1Z4_9FUNG|nr:hypothetical protein H4R34_002860 [Dimargaris verticillata]